MERLETKICEVVLWDVCGRISSRKREAIMATINPTI